MTNQLKTSHSDMDITDITNLTNRINNLHRNRSFNILHQPYINGIYFPLDINIQQSQQSPSVPTTIHLKPSNTLFDEKLDIGKLIDLGGV